MPRRSFARSLVALSLALSVASCTDCSDGTGVDTPLLVIEPNRLLFDQLEQGEESIEYLTISNAGDGDLIIDRIRLSEGPSEVFVPLHAGRGVTLETGESFDFGVLYRHDGATISGEIEIISNDPTSRTTAVPIDVLVTDARLFVAPNPVEFGRVPVGDVRVEEVMLHNMSLTPLALRDIFVVGNAFRIVNGQMGGGGEELLLEGEPRSLMLEYTSNGSTDVGSLVVRHAEGATEVPLVGNANTPCVQVEPSVVDFDVVEMGSFSERVITVRSCSLSDESPPATISRIELGAPPVHPASTDFSLDEIEPTPITVPPGAESEFIARYSPTGLGMDEGVIIIETDDPLFPMVEVPMTGVGVERVGPLARAGCREAGTDGPFLDSLPTTPLTHLECTAAESLGDVVDYAWDAFVSPGGSTVFTPSDAELTDVQIPLAGLYQLGVTVFDDAGLEDTAFVEVVSLSDDDIRVELTWVTPADPDQHDLHGSDIDLHFVHPNGCWEDLEWDVHFRNPGPDWGIRGNGSDDPKLDLDDTDGAGPENVSLRRPENVTYRIGVHYFADRDHGPSFATVRVYVRGILMFEENNKEVPVTDTWWVVADLDWRTGEVLPIDELHIGPDPPACD